MFSRTTGCIVIAAASLCLSAGCSNYKKGEVDDPSERRAFHAEARAAIARFKEEDPTMIRFFEDAYGYAVFPNVGKGGIGFGGAYGRGEVYEQGELVGYATLMQGTVGFQLGGQTYSEIIFFENALKLSDFKGGHMELSAQASAVAATEGASADADYKEGVAVFTIPKGGLMFEASVGGQKFDYDPLPHDEDADPLP